MLVSTYSATKIGADQIALSFHRSFGTPVTIIRPFNTYGPRQSARAIIPTIITQIASGQRLIKLGALRPTRDFSFVSDTVRGFIAAADSPNAIGEAINLGSNLEISIGETAAMIAKILGHEIEIETDAARLRPEASEVERLWADNSKAYRLIDWVPQYAGREGLERGLKETCAWFCEPGNLGRYRPDIYNV